MAIPGEAGQTVFGFLALPELRVVCDRFRKASIFLLISQSDMRKPWEPKFKAAG